MTPPGNHSELARAARAVARLSRVFERATGELSLAHYRVLSAVGGGDERASRVAERLTLGRPAVSAAVDALEARGLLERGAVEGDQRAAALRLTTEGRQAVRTAETAMVDRLRAVLDRTAAPAEVLHSMLELDAALESIHAERHATHRKAGS